MLSPDQIQSFRSTVLGYYYDNQRALPWRQTDSAGNFDPYKIMVSEVMLQQTQVNRVIEKYQQFLKVFPTVYTLAEASLGDVLLLWQGLGYNRRARFLREAAITIVQDYGGDFPKTTDRLVTLPGIGYNTASAILAYAHNQPVVFIETNIRTVYLHHFFADVDVVSDKDILEVVGQTVDSENPREWYWALMDYGTYLKSNGATNLRSKHYTKQSRFEGSARQVRGEILRQLSDKSVSEAELKKIVQDERFDDIIASLVKDNLIISDTGILRIAD